MKTKKKLLSVVGAIALAAVASWNVYQGRQETVLSDLMLENIEALASGEGTCEICYGFELNSYGNGCKICEQTGYGPCNIHDQVPC